MQVKNMLKIGMIAGAVLLAAACGDKASDPGTESKSDLNPPGTLWTVTQDGGVELRWTAGNVEEDLNGYYVFAVDATKVSAAGAILAAVKPTYPAGANLALSGVPRCLDNTKFFEAFGFTATDKECEDDTAPAAGAATAGATLQGGSNLVQDPAPAEGDEVEILKGFAKCEAGSSADISLTAVAPVVKTQKCLIKKLGDAAATPLANGKTYAFIVMAARDDRSKVSWTSNIIFDTPSADGLPADSTVVIGVGQVATVDLSTVATGKGTLSAAADCGASGAALSPCDRISISNTVAAAGAKVFLSRAAATGGGDYKQRLYVSGSETGSVKIQPRGPQTWDPMNKATANRIPGDEAASTYPAPGTKYVVYNNQVFDVEITATGGIYYGKLIVNDVTYADTAPTSAATLDVALVLQPEAGVRHYLTTAHLLR